MIDVLFAGALIMSGKQWLNLTKLSCMFILRLVVLVAISSFFFTLLVRLRNRQNSDVVTGSMSKLLE